ncbi:hypothetical protein [Streptomyces iranensis]|uniref:hypothetical protein n=1 Tax=Streptomyces iranensis TaxID=576784 RepID=UPI0039B78464
MFNVRKLLVGACTASLAATGLVAVGSVATATPARADAITCYRYIESFLENDDRDTAGTICRLGESMVTYSRCVHGLDELDGVDAEHAGIACRKALD